MDIKQIRQRIMCEAYDLADRGDHEGYNSVKVMCSDVLALIKALETQRLAQPEQKCAHEIDQKECDWCKPAQPEQEPVAWANSFDLKNFDMKVRTCPDLHHTVPLYTAPPKRELTCVCGAVWEGETMVHSPRERDWVGLNHFDRTLLRTTYAPLKTIYHDKDNSVCAEVVSDWDVFFDAIEAKLKEKCA